MMKKLLLILLCLPIIGFGQQTYVPDDVFEEYIELNFPLADNGIVNDDYVLTAGLDLTSSPAFLELGFSPLTSSIQDLTGIEGFVNVYGLIIQNLNITAIDLSQLTLTPSGLFLHSRISIISCPLLTDIILPSDSFNLHLSNNTYLTNIVFNPSIFILQGPYGFNISGCNSLSSIDISNILGVSNGITLNIHGNLNLSQVNLKNGFSYNWGLAQFMSNPNLFCIQVDDPNYSSISANWNWLEQTLYPMQCSYSTNCSWPSALQEHTTNKEILKVTDLLGRETKQTNQPLFYIYDDGTVEKRIVIE